MTLKNDTQRENRQPGHFLVMGYQNVAEKALECKGFRRSIQNNRLA
jgi:hypothetical protein